MRQPTPGFLRFDTPKAPVLSITVLAVTALTAMVLSVFSLSAVNAQSRANRELASGYDYLNELRARANMVAFRTNRRLQKAAQGHANYLSGNQASGHDQRRGRPGFTGSKPADRAIRAGYPIKNVSENVSGGQNSAQESVDSLMSAIYHRFGFLAFDKDEVGFGLNFRKDFHRFTFNMGDAGLSEACRSRASRSGGKIRGTYYTPCRDKRIKIPGAVYASLKQATMKRNPRVVLWPVKGGTDVPPAFFEETPDPLPDYGVSGYPVSVQFNPLSVKKAEVISFRIFQHEGPIGKGRPNLKRLREIRNTRLFTKKTDPNRKFSGLQFALFPLLPFDWHQGYVAEAVFRVDGRKERLLWHFTTRHPGAPIYKLAGRGEVLPVLPGRDYVLYLPPANKMPRFKNLKWSMARGVKIKMDPLDENTYRVRVDGAVCGEANFSIGGGRFSLRMAALDNTVTTHPPEKLYATCPEFGADYTVAGNREVLPMRPGKAYVLYFPPSARYPRISSYTYRPTTRGMKLKVLKFQNQSLKLSLQGPICGAVKMTLKDGRSFSLRLSTLDNAGGANHPPQRLYASCPEFAADYKLAGRNEIIPVISGRQYKIYFTPSPRYPRIPGMSWRYDNGVRFQLKRAGANSLTIKSSGQHCGKVLVSLKDGRTFQVQLARQDARGTSGFKGNRVPGC